MEELDNLWQKNDLSLKRKLADTETFRKNLTDAQAEEIMAPNDPEILKSMAYNCEELYPEGDERQAMRLSGKMADTFLKFLGSHPNTNVKMAPARNPRTPLKFRPAFSELMALDGTRLKASDFVNLSPEALESLEDASLDVLKAVANCAEDIEDKEIRDKVINILCSHPDPAARLELAENHWAPFSVKRRLSEDPDEDVAAVARESFNNN